MSRVPHLRANRRAAPRRCALRLLRWIVAGVVVGALAAFVTEMLRPRPVTGTSGYRAPVPATDHRVVLPGARP